MNTTYENSPPNHLKTTIFRWLGRWLMWQAIMIWQGGFFFYAAIVVPIGTEMIGGFDQGRITRSVTIWLNVIGLGALFFMLIDQLLAKRHWLNRIRYGCWLVMLVGVIASWILHPMLQKHVDAATEGYIQDYPQFYRLHETYLTIATVIWVMSLLWTSITLWPSKQESPHG